MILQSIRIYAEVLEQGLDFKEYLQNCNVNCPIINVYTKKDKTELKESDSLVTRIRKCKDVDILVTAISNNLEYPLLMVEYSTAVPVDDHRMQRSDVYYWGAVYHVPVLKISPKNKSMDKRFGGGTKLSNDIELAVAQNAGALCYFVEWENSTNTKLLNTKPNKLSCIHTSNEILYLLKLLLQCFNLSNNFEEYYIKLKNDYQNNLINLQDKINDIKKLFTKSSRFYWDGDVLVNKINRFGHAMDPDRGVLYFSNMLNGIENVTCEIQIGRPKNIDARGGYHALFDLTPHEKKLLEYVNTIITEKNNTFSCSDALYIFKLALNIEKQDIFTLSGENTYTIENQKLLRFLKEVPSITSKCIFFLSSKLILTDQNRKIICVITWSPQVVKEYLNSFMTTNYSPLNLQPLSNENSKEDIITFASAELYKKMSCNLVAVSYPGAQGDRCILVGNGRKVKRIYADIIAIEKGSGTLFIEECKENINKSLNDDEKLNNLITTPEKINGLKNLVKNVENCDINNIKISIGAKTSNILPAYNVNYLYLFDIQSNNSNTIIKYDIKLNDQTLERFFSPLMADNGEYTGQIILDIIYTIKY